MLVHLCLAAAPTAVAEDTVKQEINHRYENMSHLTVRLRGACHNVAADTSKA